MGLEQGYSKAAGRRIDIWEAMNQQAAQAAAAAQAATDAAKPKFEVPSTPEKVAEPIAAPKPPDDSSKMSTEMLDKLLSMVSDLSERFTKQEIGVEFAIDYLQEGKKANESLTKDVTNLASKIDKIADDLSILNTRLDEMLSVENPEEPVAATTVQNQVATQSTNEVVAPSAQNLVASTANTAATASTQTAQTPVLDPRLAALTV